MARTRKHQLPVLLAALALCGLVLALSPSGAPRVGAQQDSVPARPTGLTVTAVTHDSVSLGWHDPGDAGITHYQVLRRDRDRDALGAFTTIEESTGSPATSYTDTTVAPDRRYAYRVQAVNRHGVSQRSSFAASDTPAAPAPYLEADPLTAGWEEDPGGHNGVDAFTFRIAFSEDISLSAETFREHSLEVIKGSVNAGGASPESNTVEVTTESPVDICDRTTQVRDGLLGVGEVTTTDCALVDADELATVATLDLTAERIFSLDAGDFAGLSGLTNLVLEVNRLEALPAGVFDPLTNLTWLDLCINYLRSLPVGVFDQLTKLTNLDLYFIMNLTTLPAGVFDKLTNLETLDLYSNPDLSSLPDGVFDKLTKLTTLNLSRNPQLSSLPDGVFDKLTKLTTLNLRQNYRLSPLPAGLFDQLTSLETLDLRSNPERLLYSPYLLAPLTSLDTLNDKTYTRPSAPAAPTELTGAYASGQIELSWTAPSGGGKATSYQILRQVGSGPEEVYVEDTYNTNRAAITYADTEVVLGETYRYRVRALNAGGAGAESGTAEVTARDNQPPDVTLNSPPGPVRGGQTLTLTATASDPEGDMLTYAWSSDPPLGSFSNAATLSTTWTAPTATSQGQRTDLTLTVTDDGDPVAMTTVSRNVLVKRNGAPEVSVSPTDITVRGGETVTLDGTATDPEDDALIYVWVSSPATGAFANSAALDTTWTAPAATDAEQFIDLVLLATEDRAGGLFADAPVHVTVLPAIAWSVTADPGTIPEDGGVSTVTVSSGGHTFSEPQTITLVLAGTATKATDYSVAGETLTLPAAATSVTTTITAVSDSVSEGSETVQVTARFGGEDVGETATITIAEGTTLTLEVDPAAIAEAGGASTVTVSTIGGTFAADQTITLVLTGSATKATDYIVAAETLTLVAGTTSVATTITAVDDVLDDNAETIVVTARHDGSDVGPATITISDDDVPVDIVWESAPNALEGAGELKATLTATAAEPRAPAAGFDLQVSTAPGSAQSPDDYAAIMMQTLTFAANDFQLVAQAGAGGGGITSQAPAFVATKEVVVTLATDLIVEADETFEVQVDLALGTSALVTLDGGRSGISETATILDDDTAAFSLSASPMTIAETGGTSTVTVTTSKAFSTGQTVELQVGNFGAAPATEGTDFTISPKTLPLAAGQKTVTATVSALDDSETEGDEKVRVRVGHNGNVQPAAVVITISDDDSAGIRVSSMALAVPEGSSSSYTVRLNTQPTGTVTVAITGQAGTDLSVSPASLTFTTATWEEERTVTVTAAQDPDAAPDAAVTLTHAATGGGYESVPDVDVTVTIAEDEAAAIVVSSMALTVEEGETETYTVRLQTPPSVTVAVIVTSSDTEVTATPQSLVFTSANWSLDRTVTVEALDDEDAEADPPVTLTHTATGGEYASVAATVSVTVTDDEITTGPLLDICERTTQVRDGILGADEVTATDCALVDADELATVAILDLEAQMITALDAGDFAGLTGLTNLVLEDNQLQALPAGVFDPLTSLTWLDLCINDLRSLPAGVFDQLTNLTDLDLYFTINLTTLPAGVFDKLTNLETLDLYGNLDLASLPDGVFDQLTNLATLNLRRNPQLSSLPDGVFDKLTSLTTLDLSHNHRLSPLPGGLFDSLTSLISLDLRSHFAPLLYSPYLLAPLTSLDTLDDQTYSRPSAPGVPTGLTGAYTTAQIELSWTAPSGGAAATSYQILRQVGSGPEEVYVEDTYNTNGAAVTYADTEVILNETYRYRVRALNAGGAGAESQPVELTTALDLSGPATVTYPENRAVRVATYTATGPTGPAWSLSGADSDKFSLEDGVLRFLLPPEPLPDYESPSDADGDNVYTVTVAITAGADTASTDVAVSVTNADEGGAVTLSTLRPSTGTAVTAAVSDPDVVTAGTVSWQWERFRGLSDWTAIDGATSAGYTPTAADSGYYLRATASYTDGEGAGKSAQAMTTSPPLSHELSSLAASNSAGGMYPVFDPPTLHYAVSCAASDIVTLSLSPKDAGARVAVNGIQRDTANDVVLTEVDPDSDILITLSGSDGAFTTYVVHCIPDDYPTIEVTERKAGAWDGLILGGATMGDRDAPNRWSALLLFDTNGVPRFHRRLGDFGVNHLKPTGGGLYPFGYAHGSPPGSPPGGRVSLMDHDLAVASFIGVPASADADEYIDAHDFAHKANGNTVIVTDDPTTRDLSAFKDVDGNPLGTAEEVEDNIIRELAPSGATLFTWNSWDHVELGDCAQHNFPGEYAWFNSIEVVDGNYLVSLKGCSKIVLIDGASGEMIWRLGKTNLTDQEWIDNGRTPPLKIVGDTYGEFCGQHSAKILDNGHLVLYDNGNVCVRDPETGQRTRQNDQFSRVVEYALDPEQGEAVFVRHHSFKNGFDMFTSATGLVAPIDNGNWLISWGRASDALATETISEVNPATDEELLHIRIEDGSGRRHATRSYPLRADQVGALSAVEPLAADFPSSASSSVVHLGPTDRPTVVVAFNQPVVDPTSAAGWISVQGATIESVSPHIISGEAANAHLITLIPAGDEPITLSLIASHACAMGGICTADGMPLSATVSVTVRFNHAPTVSATATPATVNGGGAVTLDGTASDPDPGDTLTHAWTSDGGGSFDDASTLDATWTAPAATGADQIVTLTLTVTDTAGVSAEISKSVTVRANQAPAVSVSTTPLTVGGLEAITLTGSASDPEHDALTYAWTSDGGGTFATPAALVTTWTAPAKTNADQNIVLTLAVTDSGAGALTGVATVSVTVRANLAPTASATPLMTTINGGGLVSLTGVANDLDQDALTYEWTSDGGGSFNDPSALIATWTAPPATTVDQRITLTLTVTDAVSAAATAQVSVTVRANQAPIVSVSPPSVTVDGGGTVTLGGTSSDPEGDTLTYAWTSDGGGTFTTPSALLTTWTAPAKTNADQSIVLTLTVADNGAGALTSMATVSVTVRANQAPTVTVSPPTATVDGGGTVTLGGTSSDPEGDTLTYAWTSNGGGSFDNASVPDATWTAPDATSSDQSIVLTLTVTESGAEAGALADTATVSVTVRANQAPTVTVSPPTATVNGGDVLSLDGTATDPEGHTLTHAWTSDGGGSFDNASVPDATWTAPAATGSDQRITLTLTVTDDGAGTLEGTATVSVTVSALGSTAPTASASGMPTTVHGRGVVTLTGTANDPLGDTLSYAWSSDGGGSFDDAAALSTTWTAPAAASSGRSITLSLMVTNTAGESTTATVGVRVLANQAPTVSVSPESVTVDGGDTVRFDITAFDPEGDTLTYKWSTDGGGTFVWGTFTYATWTAPPKTDAVQHIVLTLIVTDSDAGALTGMATVSVTVRANLPPTASVSATPTTVHGGGVVTLDGTASDPDGGALTYEWTGPGGGSFGDAAALDTTWTAPKATSADQNITLFLTVTDTASATTTFGVSVRSERDAAGVGWVAFATAEDTVSITVRANQPPEVSVSPATAAVDGDGELALTGTATDPEGDDLTYAWSSDGWGSFDDDAALSPTWTAPPAEDDPRTITLTLRVTDNGIGALTGMATVEVTVGQPVTPPTGPGGGGGGGGGGPSGPSPSELDFEWNVKRDLEALDGGHDTPTGSWSDGTVLWIAENGPGAGDAVYAYDLQTGERVEEREFELDERNRAPRGVWSGGTVIWVSDSGQDRLFAHDLETGERLPERDLELGERNGDARGIWSDGETMWVLDGGKDRLFAYDLGSGELVAEYALDDANGDPHGIWSDGVTIWVSDHGAKRLLAYRLEGEALVRNSEEEFTELSKASNNSPRGIWSDGEVIYVADESDDKVYSYNMPDAIDARLAALTLSGIEIGEFTGDRTEYEGVAAEGVTETTVEAATVQRRTTVLIEPADADGDDTNGHQLALEGIDAITVTVTSADGSRTRVYRVRLEGGAAQEAPWTHCLRGDVAEGFSLVVYEGGGVEDLVTCAESRDVVALYALHGGVYVSYILGAPGFVNQPFVELFADGVPPVTPLVAGSSGPPSADPNQGDGALLPWPECLRGEIAAGFSLVIYEGGSVDDLVACAASLRVTALYALHDGEFVPYILGAPDFVNREFRELFPRGLPPLTPLVARSEEPPTAGSDRDGAATN